MTPISDRRKATAEQTGIDERQVAVVQQQLRVLRENGLLISVHVRGISMFRIAVAYEELGIADTDLRRARFSTGTKYIIPDNYWRILKSTGTRLRQITSACTFKISGFHPWEWMPYTAHAAWKPEWERVVADFDRTRDEIIDNYDYLRQKLADDFAQIAAETWNRSLAAAVEAGYGSDSALKFGGIFFETRERYTDHVIQNVLARFPSQEKIATELRADYNVAVLASNAEVEADLLAADQLRAQRDIEWAKVEAEEIRTRELRDQADSRERERQIKRQAMRDAELEHARKQLSEMGSPIAEAIEQLCGRILDDLDSIAASVKKHGYVRGKIAQKAAGLLEFYDLMAAIPMAGKLRQRLADIKTQIGPIGTRDRTTQRNPDDVLAALEAARQAARDRLAGLDDVSRFDALELD